MDNKLSELSKPVQIFEHPHGRAFWCVVSDNVAGTKDVHAYYSQEYVSALLEHISGLEYAQFDLGGIVNGHAKRVDEAERRIAELNGILGTYREQNDMWCKLASTRLQRIAELERITEGVDQLAIDGGWTARGMSEYAKSLEKKLATPVRLPDESSDAALSPREYPNLGNFGLGYNAAINDCKEAIRAAGFTFTVEGDE